MKKFLLSAILALSCTLLLALGPAPHGITWSWSNPAGAASNHLYCGTSSKNYTLAWTISPAATSYDWLTTDTTNPPTQGTKYFCAVTATDAFGIESGVSGEAFATFPTVPLAPTGLSPLAH